MDFCDKAVIFEKLRQEMLGEVTRCKSIKGRKRVKTDPVNKKLWGDLYPQLLRNLKTVADEERWTAEKILDCRLRLFYCALVVNLETRNEVVPYDYMDFARRVGELWERLCKICWDAPVNRAAKRLPPISFATVKSDMLERVEAIVSAGKPSNQDAVIAEVNRLIELLGNINLKEDEYCSFGKRKLVIDFKSGFGSNEKGNTERLLTVAKIYGALPERHECVLVVRASEEDGNAYLGTLRASGLWDVRCGPGAYKFIQQVTGFDLASWIGTNVDFRADMEKTAYQHLDQHRLTKYLEW